MSQRHVCACVCACALLSCELRSPASQPACLPACLLAPTLLCSHSIQLVSAMCPRWCLGFSLPTWVIWTRHWTKYTLLEAWERKQRFFRVARVMWVASPAQPSSRWILYWHQMHRRVGLSSAEGAGAIKRGRNHSPPLFQIPSLSFCNQPSPPSSPNVYYRGPKVVPLR